MGWVNMRGNGLEYNDNEIGDDEDGIVHLMGKCIDTVI
jgi:hypothetical protein